MCYVPEGTSGKQCNPTGLCGNSSPLNWCAGGPDQGGCYGGSIGGRGIMQMTPKEIESSHDVFWGINTKEGLLLKGVGVLREAGLRIGDTLKEIREDQSIFKLSNKDSREKVLTLDFAAAELLVIYERDGADQLGVLANPPAK